MPTTITSDRIIRQTKTTYAWNGSTNNWGSTKSVDGVVQRTNYATDPSLTGTVMPSPSQVTRSQVTDWSVAGGAAMRLTPVSGATNDSYQTIYTGPLVVGQTYTVSATIRVPAAHGSTNLRNRARGIAVFYGRPPGGNVGELQSAKADNVAGTVARVSVTFTVDSARQPEIRLYNGSDQPADVVDWDAVLLEAGTEVGEYFDGNSAGSTVITYASSAPLVVTGYEAVRQVRNVFNTVLGTQSTVATVFPAGLRSGTLTAVFGTRADAVALDGMLAGTDVLTYTDTDVPDAGMRFLPDGTIKVAPDTTPIDLGGGATGFLWLVEFGYQEVAA